MLQLPGRYSATAQAAPMQLFRKLHGNPLCPALWKTVTSNLAKALDGNYPNKSEYKAQLRVWSFQHETYA